MKTGFGCLGFLAMLAAPFVGVEVFGMSGPDALGISFGIFVVLFVVFVLGG